MAVDFQIYRKLQERLDKLPVGYPPTESGVEIRILKAKVNLLIPLH